MTRAVPTDTVEEVSEITKDLSLRVLRLGAVQMTDFERSSSSVGLAGASFAIASTSKSKWLTAHPEPLETGLLTCFREYSQGKWMRSC